jgi:hypothetical protein
LDTGDITTVYCPDGVRADDLVGGIARIFGESNAFGRVSGDTFYLDPAQLASQSSGQVIDLLIATGNTLRQLGGRVDVNAGVGVAGQILGTL